MLDLPCGLEGLEAFDHIRPVLERHSESWGRLVGEVKEFGWTLNTLYGKTLGHVLERDTFLHPVVAETPHKILK